MYPGNTDLAVVRGRKGSSHVTFTCPSGKGGKGAHVDGREGGAVSWQLQVPTECGFTSSAHSGGKPGVTGAVTKAHKT